MDAANINDYQARVDAKPPEDVSKYSCHAFNANFAEVRVHETTGTIRIPRLVAVTGAGRILNAKTARSQIIGGCVWGIGMALTEESVLDPHRDLAETVLLHAPGNRSNVIMPRQRARHVVRLKSGRQSYSGEASTPDEHPQRRHQVR